MSERHEAPRDATPETRTTRHVPALDGLRGAAVAGVLLFHTGRLRGGFLGVDLFFVLSGFLITGLLLAERARTGSVSLRSFWARRARRLLPAVLVVVVAVALWFRFQEVPTRFDDLRGEGLATLAYVANWWSIFRGSGYWNAFDAPSPFEHTWSLSIEEQFYAVWPVLLVGLLAWRGRAALRWVTAGLVAVSVLLLEVLADPRDPTRAYFGTDARIAAPLYGALLAIWAGGRSRSEDDRVEHLIARVAPVAVGVLVLLWWRADGVGLDLYRWQFPLAGAAAATVIAAVSGPVPGLVGRAFSWAPLRHLGIISYGLYLWHWPVFLVLDEHTGFDGWTLTALQFAASLVAAEVSLALIERPVRSGRVSTSVWRVAAPAGLVIAVVALVVPVDRVEVSAASLGGRTGTGAHPEADPNAAAPQPTVPLGPQHVVLVGDSGSVTLQDELAGVAAERGWTVAPGGMIGCYLTSSGDGLYAEATGELFIPEPEGCDDWPQRWRQLVLDEQPDAAIMVPSWPGVGAHQIDGELQVPCEAAFDRYYADQVRTAIASLSASGAPVFLATSPPVVELAESVERVGCINRTLRSVAEDEGATIIDLADWVCPDGACVDVVDGVVLREDGLHFDGDGAVLAGRWLLDQMAATLSSVAGPAPPTPGGP